MRGDQTQKAGAGSNQYQVTGDLHVHEDITEARATEIARAAAQEILSTYSKEAHAVGEQRVDEFTERLVSQLLAVDKLDAFRDPAFQVLLRKAQLGAASSGSVSDYELLTSLLTDKVKRGADRTVSAAIDRAVQVIDLVDYAALTGLTAAMTFQYFTATVGDIYEGMDALEEFYAQMELDQLPTGSDWVDHLDALGLVRGSFGGLITRIPATDYWPQRMPGYVSVGLPLDAVQEAVRRQVDRDPTLVILPVDHALKPGFQRLPLPNVRAVTPVLAARGMNEAEQDAYINLLLETFHVDTIDADLKNKIFEEASKRPSLAILQDWWDSIPVHFDLTGIGRVVARANADRLDVNKRLPPRK